MPLKRNQTKIYIHISYDSTHIYRLFENRYNKVMAFQIFPVEFTLFLFYDYYWKVVIILIYLTKYSETTPWTVKWKIFCVKIFYDTASYQGWSSKIQKEVQF